MNDPIGVHAAFASQMGQCRRLLDAAADQGYLMIPRIVDAAGKGVTAPPWQPGVLTEGTRGWLGGFYTAWCAERARYPLILWTTFREDVAVSMLFSTPKTLKWNGINAPLLLLTGGTTKVGPRASVGNYISCTERSTRGDFSVRSPDMCEAVMAILELPANRAFLAGGNTMGRR